MKCCNVQTEKILEETIPLEGELKVNCRLHWVLCHGRVVRWVVNSTTLVVDRFCHTRGAAVSMRPKCNLCGQETAILDTMSHITRGESLWNDITNSHGECLSCNKKVDVAWGFLCTATINGKICPSRRVRDMIIVYQPGKAPLVDTLNEVCCANMFPRHTIINLVVWQRGEIVHSSCMNMLNYHWKIH